ncbi:helix-turn-helix transcriptional regulator [Faecalibacter bovis]|uniref:Sigma-70 region 4 domain-containing protein n=1 Tax=Faecalibacter bovis TaxID=2898187 RepID=A0ABX7XC98_9FLAO|nr:hypothetical protein [Faecalibacter bovis]QTV05515.1 sigma-70 region 4 domain-containing protein [Faecalibacter bovis]
MNYFDNIRNWLYTYIFYYGIDETLSKDDREFKMVINQYSLVLFIVFFIISVFNYIHFNFSIDVFIISILAVGFGASPYIFKNLKPNRKIIYVITVIITLIINYYSHFCGLESGVFLYFLPLLITVGVLFNQKKDPIYFHGLILFIILNMYCAVILEDVLIVPKSEINPFEQKALQLLNLSCILIVKFLIYLIIVDKWEGYHLLEHRNILKREEISHLQSEVIRLKAVLNSNMISEDFLNELIECIPLSDTIFIEKFEIIYPDFFDKIKALAQQPLNQSDLKYCALFKLGYSTKQIAIYTDTTIKSVESRKYRIRKKLKLNSNSSTFLENF